MTDQPDHSSVPQDLAYLFDTDRLGHVTAIRRDGSIAAYLMWVEWDGTHMLTSSPVGSRKGANWRRNPQASVTVVDAADPWRFVVVRGRVIDFRPDEGLAFIDRMSLRYTGAPYRRRNHEREIFVVTPDHIIASPGRGG